MLIIYLCLFNTFEVLNGFQNTVIQSRVGTARSTLLMMAKKKKHTTFDGPEFSRILNIEQLPPNRPVMCKLVAKETEKLGLANRFDLELISYFAANMTAVRADQRSILVEGSLEAHIKVAEMAKIERVRSNFDTLLLDTTSAGVAGIDIEDAMDFDDEISDSGNIDIGEIASQYLSLEIGF